MVFRTSYKGLVIWFGIAALLALAGLGIASSESDSSCGEFGYLRVDSFTCEASSGLSLAYFFGGNCLLAGLSLAWATYKNSRAQAGLRFVTYDMKPSAEYKEGPSIVYQNRIAPEHPEKADIENGIDGLAREASGSGSASVSSLERETRALSVEQSESLRFGSVVPVSRDQVANAVQAQTSVFRFTQESLTGIAISVYLKEGGNAERLSGFELSEYFLHGTAVGRLLFGFQPTANQLLGETRTDELVESLSAVREDAVFLSSMAFETLDKFLGTLPAGVGLYLSESLIEEEVSKFEAEYLTRMFVAGIAYVGFQAPPRPEEPTW